MRWSEETPAGARSGALLRRYQVTEEGLEGLRTTRGALMALSRGLDGLLERA